MQKGTADVVPDNASLVLGSGNGNVAFAGAVTKFNGIDSAAVVRKRFKW